MSTLSKDYIFNPQIQIIILGWTLKKSWKSVTFCKNCSLLYRKLFF